MSSCVDVDVDDVPFLAEDFALKLSQLPHKLSRKSPKSPEHLWVFWWSKDEGRYTSSSTRINNFVPGTLIDRSTINEKIKSAFCNFKGFIWGEFLFQFWAPIMRENHHNQCILSTYDQPFGLRRVKDSLWNYMMQSKKREIIVDGKREEELGPIGRVFRNKLPEFSPNIQRYSNKEFPMLSKTIACGVWGIRALPVLDPSSWCCVGVLEIVYNLEGNYSHHVAYKEACRVLKEAGLGSLDMFYHLNEENALDEIRNGLELVRSTYQLRLAQAWIPCGQSKNAVAYSGNLGKSRNSFGLSSTEEVMTVIAKSSNEFDDDLEFFSATCKDRPLGKCEGLVGKALLSHKPCFCMDIAKVSIIDYPLAHCAKERVLSSCFAICLRNINTGNRDYVLELFMPHCHTHSVHSLLRSILSTMKQHFPSFKVASREELGEELSAKVIEFWTNNEPDSSQICKTTRSLPLFKAAPNEDEMEQVDSSSQQSSMENAIQNENNLVGAKQGDIADTDLKKTCIISEKEGKNAETSISKEVIKGYYGRNLEDVAVSLGISRSTLKRLCRKYNIPRWPSHKRNKVNRAPSNVEHMNKFVHGGEEGIPKSCRRDPSCSDPPRQATAVVAYTTPHVTTMQDARTVTIKAKYRKDTIRFQLSFTSGMADLWEKVTKRMPSLEDIPFSIKYLDDEGEWILIACDEDLQCCMGSCSSPNKTPIKMLVQAITKAP